MIGEDESAYHLKVNQVDCKKFLKHIDHMRETPQGSMWLDMLVCQPPSKRVRLQYDIRCREINPYHIFQRPDRNGRLPPGYYYCDRENGVRLRDLAEMFEYARGVAEEEFGGLHYDFKVNLLIDSVTDELSQDVLHALYQGRVLGIGARAPLVPVQLGRDCNIGPYDPRHIYWPGP